MSYAAVLGDPTTYGATLIATGVKLNVQGKPVAVAGDLTTSGGGLLPPPSAKLSVGGLYVAVQGTVCSDGDVVIGGTQTKLLVNS